MTVPCSATYFLDAGAHVSLKVDTKRSCRNKKLWKFSFSCCFSKAKTEKCDQQVWNVFHEFTVGKPCPATYFLEVGARASLKLATKVFLRGKKNSENLAFQVALLKQKRRNAAKKFEMFLMNLALVNLVQLHIFWK